MKISKRLAKNLSSLKSEDDPHIDLVTSSVLMIISKKNNEYGINFIKRAAFPGDSFSGHVAFPGGKKKKSDTTPLDTALRETKEEVGIDIHDCGEVIGSLDTVKPFTESVRHFVVKPYVSILKKDVEFKKNYEVQEVFWVSIKHLINIENRTVREKTRDEIIIYDYVFNYNNYIIWGLTGRILNQFFERTGKIFESNF